MNRFKVTLLTGVFASGLIAESRWDLGIEWVGTGDVDLIQTNANRAWELPEKGWSGDLSFATNVYALDYAPVPFDFLGEAVSLEEWNFAVQSAARKRLRENLELTFNAGAYDGHTNYRSIWLAEYYRQQFEDRSGLPGDGYRRPQPKGGGAGTGVRWEYVKASGFLGVSVSARRDEVAPGYEIDFEGLRRSREYLNATTFSVSTENVLTSRLRSRLEVRASRVSARDWRIGGEGALNVALGEHVVARLVAGGAHEDPQFEAWYGGLLVDWTWAEGWAVFAEARHYEDTGEIENALLFTSAAPGLESQQASVGIRWVGINQSWRLKIGRSVSDYESPDPRLDFFQNLYADRDWTLVQLSYSRTF